MTAATEYADAVLCAVRALRRHLDAPDPDRAKAAAGALLSLEKARLATGRDPGCGADPAAAEEYADAVLHAVRTLRRLLGDPDDARSLAAGSELLALDSARVRHGRDVAGTAAPRDDDEPAVDAEPLRPGVPWERGRPGRTNEDEEGRHAETPQAPARDSKSGRDGRAPREESADPQLAQAVPVAGGLPKS